MAWTYNSLADAITTYLLANVDDAATTYTYLGKYWSVDKNSDFTNSNNGNFPFLGIAFDEVIFAKDQSMGATNPIVRAVFSAAFRQSGARPLPEVELFLTAVQKLQDCIMATCQQDATPFGYAEIRSAQPFAIGLFPSFIGKQEGNRKGYNVAQFGVELRMNSI